MIPLFDGHGAIIASIIAETLISTIYIIKSNGFITMRIVIKYSWKKVISGAVMLLIIYNLNNVFDIGTLSFILSLLVGFFSYLIVLLILKDSSIQLIFDILNKLRRRK